MSLPVTDTHLAHQEDDPTMNWTRIRKQLGTRSAIVGAGVAGFLVGAGGFVAAQIDDSPRAEQEIDVENTIDDSPTTTDDTMPETTVADSMPDDSTSPTSIDLTVPDTTDDSSSSTAPDTTTDDHGGDRHDDDSDDHSTSTAPDTTTDDSTSSTVPASLPDAFSRSYESSGGSIEVTWTGTSFVLDSISPAPGFVAEIEDQSWDRIRVDFEGESDARIEVRLTDGQIRVRID